MVGAGLSEGGAVRKQVLAALVDHEPMVVALGAKATSVAAVVPESRMELAVRDVHQRFFE